MTRSGFRSGTLRFPGDLQVALDQFLERLGLAGAGVAVRSSATGEDSARASFAGIHRSVLNVRGREEISRAILACYGSLWTPQALAYRRRMGYRDDEVLCALVVCEMVGAGQPRSAGVGFTLDPATRRRDLIVIDAAPGLGEAVVSGQVDPRRIVFRIVRNGIVFEARSGATPLLPPERERELANHLSRIEWALGEGQHPQDVEWAFDGDALWFLQARPVTGIRRAAPNAVAVLPRYWSTANIKDAVPGVVCMMSWSLIKVMVESIAFAGPVAAGYELPRGTELVRRFRGRGYFDLTLMQWVLYDALGVTPAETSQAVGGHQPEIPVPGDPMKGPEGRRRAKRRLRLLLRLWRIERELDDRIRSQEALLRSWREIDASRLTTEEMAAIFDRITREHAALDVTAGLANSAEGPWELALENLLKPAFGERARPLAGRLLAGTGTVTSAEHGYAILQLASTAREDPAALEWLDSGGPASQWMDLPAGSRFRGGLARFLEKYGHRAVYEADLMNPRWVEDPSYVLDQVRCALSNPGTVSPRESARRIREEAEQEVRRTAGWRTPVIFWVARKLRKAMAFREAAKSALVASLLPSKRILLDIGRRLVEGGHLDEARQIFHLSFADLRCWMEGWWDGSGARELAGDRAREREDLLNEDAPPDVIAEDPEGRVTTEAQVSARDGEVWTGIGAAPGLARGAARIIRHPGEAQGFRSGDVLVAPSTDPGWTPLFLRASGIVMETGGYLSHGAIVAREYGIPAVVNLPGILGELNQDDVLVVDGDRGRVVRESIAATVSGISESPRAAGAP